MVRLLRFGFLAALAATLVGCGRKSPQAEAAQAARELLAAAWSGDAAGFEARLDRPAVRQDLRRQLAQLAQASTLSVEGGASDAALDRMISPAAFRVTAADGGALAAEPSAAQVEPLVAAAGKDHACLHAAQSAQPCLLSFAREAQGWKLVAMAPAGFTIALPPEPSKDR